ncbi:MAG: hypothetical protein HYV07_21920 [Deltaproteobacteria bacterium]|nr:hypothetical protein [Deltaproteobacteria bacterium]
MADIGALRTNTTQAAQAALNAGMISGADFKRMTDGTVSLKDVTQAKNLVGEFAGGDAEKLGIAESLHHAITQQNAAQGTLRSIYENVKDGLSPQTSKEVIQNIKA